MAQLRYSAKNTLFSHANPKNPNRSRQDLTRTTNFTADAGMIIPFDWFPVLIGDEITLSNTIGLESLPTITNLLSPFRIVTHWYYQQKSSIWAAYPTALTKGRSGNVNISFPKVDLSPILDESDGSYLSFNLPHSLASFLGVPPLYRYSQTENDGVVSNLPADYLSDGWIYDESIKNLKLYKPYRYVNALPFMLYQQICKYNYVNPNFLQGNKKLFPEEGDRDWMLPYNIPNNVCNMCDGSLATTIFEVSGAFNSVYSNNDKNVSLLPLRYAQFDDDYFTTALVDITRGTPPALDFNIDTSNFFSYNGMTQNGQGTNVVNAPALGSGSHSQVSGLFGSNSQGRSVVQSLNNMINYDWNGSVSMTANQFRQLMALSVWQERNARVDGSYNSLMWVHFSENPHLDEHKPQFIGGTSDFIGFDNVQTTVKDSSAPLGTVASRGQMFGSQNVCSSFHCTDNGYIMGIMIVTPQTTYNNGIEHELSCLDSMEDEFFPEFENLAPQPILNKELFISGNPTIDEGLFGYQERYSYLKTRQNVNRGLFQLPKDSDILFSSATLARDFSSTPKLSNQFSTMSPNNIRRDWLAVTSEPMFKIQVASNVSVIRNIGAKSQPATFGF